MITIFDQFSSIILEYQTIFFREDSKISEQKYRIIFKDKSILEYTEIVIHEISKRKYAFQYMDMGYNLLIRWDNSLHYPQIESFPHHKHIGKDNTIEPSRDISLFEVLTEIKTIIA